ncbi:MAG: hypothetical protein BMS9Abin36_1970 [Gammaproteobacteria bacterium]|nr:MAG: hypothetical protein BMS9Abin36_1970 [Gammaproteobacteria bacterium]
MDKHKKRNFLFISCLISSYFSIATAFASGSEFSHKYLTLDLPEGWSTGQVPEGSEKQTIGVLKSSSIKASSITLDCYRGALHTHASTRIRGLNTISATYPAGQEQLKKPYKIKTQGGKGKAELWRGYIKIGNQTVALQTPMAAIKTKHCWLVALGFTPDSSGEAMEKDFLTIMKSAR